MDNFNNNGNRNVNGGNGGNDGKMPKNTQTIIILIISGLIMVMLISFMSNWMANSTTKEITYNEFLEKLEEESIASVQIQSDRIVAVPKAQLSNMMQLSYYTGIAEDITTVSARCEAAGI